MRWLGSAEEAAEEGSGSLVPDRLNRWGFLFQFSRTPRQLILEFINSRGGSCSLFVKPSDYLRFPLFQFGNAAVNRRGVDGFEEVIDQ